MTALAFAVQKALYAALIADTAVAALVGTRVYDRVPADAASPYLAIGEIQVVDDGADGMEGAGEVYITLHAWSTAYGSVEARMLSGAAAAALHGAELDLGDDWILIEILLRDSRTFTDADGVTTHGVITFRALVDPAST